MTQIDNTAQAQPDAVPTATNKSGNGKRHIGLVLLLLILGAVLIGGWQWYQSKIELTTDDAFIDSDVHLISARINGQIASVHVSDNQKVAAGALLVSIDPAKYRAEVATKQAQLALAHNTIQEEQASVAAAQASVVRARAQLDQTISDLRRGVALFAEEVIAKERLEQLKTAQRVASASLAQAQQQLRATQARLSSVNTDGQQARIAQSTAALELAQLNLAYTQITAPVAGYITSKSVQLGTNVQAGQPLLAIVELEQPWIVANYKEGQLTHLAPGQRVEFSVDAYPGQIFRGQVESIMAGTGAAFSLLPPENATGNYVKVVQRIPVKITIDPNSDPEHKLRVGMSVEPTIFTGRRWQDILVQLNPFY